MRTRAFTVVQLIVLVAVFGILAALFLPAVGSRPPLTDKDLDLANWQPTAEHWAVPPDLIRVRATDITGTWTDRIGWIEMAVNSVGHGGYGVVFRSRGRCGLGGSVLLERVAKYEDGILLLDRPVRELTGTTYQRLFSVRIADQLCLVPSIRVEEIHPDMAEIPYRGVLTRIVDQ